MADSVVRNATKEDNPDIGYDEIVRMLEEDPYALDPLDQDTTTAPEEFIEPRDAIRDKILNFGGSEMEGGLADPSGILDAPMSDKVYMREGGLAMSGGGPLDSFRQFLMETIDQQQVDPFIDEVNQMASERFNLGGSSSGGQSVFGPLKTFNASQPLMDVAEPLPQPSIFQRIPEQYPQDLSRPKIEFAPVQRPMNKMSMFQQPTYSYDQAQRMNMTRDVKPPHIQAAIDAALQQGPLKSVGSDMFTTLDQQIYNDGIMPGNTYLTGSRQFESASPLTGELPRLFADGGGVASLMKKTTVEMQEVPADRNMLVMNRLMKQGGVTETRDPRLMAQLAQVLGRDG